MDGSDTSTYRAVLAEFLPAIRESSEPAAAYIGQILEKYGSRAAYLAAYALLFIKLQQDERQREPHLQDLNTYTFYAEMGQDAEALALYRQAAVALLPALHIAS